MKVRKKARNGRPYVKICAEVHNKLIKVAKPNQYDRPTVFLLGADSKGIIREAEKVARTETGCDEMPTISQVSMHKLYLKLTERNLVPCGLARTRRQFNNPSAKWNGMSGNAIKHCGDLMLSVTADHMRAEFYEAGQYNVIDILITNK